MNVRTKWYGICVLCFASVILAPAQSFSDFAGFNGTNGTQPLATVVQATDGNLYGTTISGGAHGYGSVVKIALDGTITVLYDFCAQSGCPDGREPHGPMIQATDGYLYGTTAFGGVSGNYGTVFRISLSGTFTTIYKFCSQTNCADGAFAYGGVIQGADGNLYGTTNEGGDPTCFPSSGCGTVYKLTRNGKLTTLHVFHGTDGEMSFAALVQATDGNFYGTTGFGGPYSYGTVFKISPSGKFTNLYNFCAQTYCADGSDAYGALVQGTDGNFYSTTEAGGTHGAGTIFKITPKGVLTVLHSFNISDGYDPANGLLQATDGSFYGTTYQGGNWNQGTAFKITPLGTLTTLYSFGMPTTGCTYPNGLMQDTNGNLYGTAQGGGAYNNGAVFKIDVGLGPFVKTLTASGKPGQVVNILGQGLTGSASVKFGSGAATFTVVSDTYITATIPTSGTTGFIAVTTPTGTLTSNKSFKVIPTLTSFNPTSGAPGTSVTLTGTGLMATTKVTFGGVNASFAITSGTQVTTAVPAGAKTGKIAVTTTGGTASKGIFTVTSSPVITSLLVNGTPSNSGKIGDTLTIQGSGFGATMGFSEAALNGVALAGAGVKPISWSDTSIVAKIPQTADSGPVVVSVANAGSSNPMNFAVAVVITGVSPTSAPVGTIVSVEGNGFGTTGGTVTFNGTPATWSGWTDTLISVPVPAGATAGPIVVTVNGQVSNGFPFTPTP